MHICRINLITKFKYAIFYGSRRNPNSPNVIQLRAGEKEKRNGVNAHLFSLIADLHSTNIY